MPTIAQIKAMRQLQAKRIRAAVRTLDTKQELLQRSIISMTRKRKVIEAADVPPLMNKYRDMVSVMNSIEKEIVGLATLTAN